MADITILNLNMLYVRYYDKVERERHLPLGPLYVTAALEQAGFGVDLRDYQLHDADELFSAAEIVRFLDDPAPVVGFSCMANLLPFTLLAMKAFRERYPDRVLVLAGVGPKSVEQPILERFPWVDVIVRGEAEISAPKLLASLNNGGDLHDVPGVSFRHDGAVVHTPAPPRIRDLDASVKPAWHQVPLDRYTGFGVITSRGCPYPCTFCSVAPIWSLDPCHRSVEGIVDEMRFLKETGGAKLILFQDEFFLTGRKRVMAFCDALERAGLDLLWKAFGRINLTDEDMMRRMADCGCVEIRFGVESGSDEILAACKKGFTSAQAVEVVSKATRIFRRTDLFYVWGYPFETMEQFYQSVFQMISFRMMGARILPSMLCLLPQTEIFRENVDPSKLEFAPDIFPEYMITGHEISRFAHVEITSPHAGTFDFIQQHRDLFPGFFHLDLANNIRPKLRVLQEFGFYPASDTELREMESCGAHSPRVNHGRGDLATGGVLPSG